MKQNFTPDDILDILKQLRHGTSIDALCKEHMISVNRISRWISVYDPKLDEMMNGNIRELKEKYSTLKEMYVQSQIELQKLKSHSWINDIYKNM